MVHSFVVLGCAPINPFGKKYVQGVHVLVGGFIETLWSGYFQVWNPEEKSLVYWGSGEEVWEVTTYADAARYTVAVALDASAVGFRRCKLGLVLVIIRPSLFLDMHG